MSEYLQSLPVSTPTLVIGIIVGVAILGIAYFLNRKINSVNEKVESMGELGDIVGEHAKVLSSLGDIFKRQDQHFQRQDAAINEILKRIGAVPVQESMSMPPPQPQAEMQTPIAQQQQPVAATKSRPKKVKKSKSSNAVNQMDEIVLRELNSKSDEVMELECVGDTCTLKPTKHKKKGSS